MTVPNILTLLRILLTPVLVWLLLDNRFGWAFIVFVLAGITDGLDGLIARVLHQRSRLGAYLDPLADKLLLVSSFILLGHQGILPNWVTIIVVSRDAMIVLGILTLMFHQVPVEIKPSVLSKITTLVQLITVMTTLMAAFLPVPRFSLQALFALTALLTVASGLHYILLALRLWERGASGSDKETR